MPIAPWSNAIPDDWPDLTCRPQRQPLVPPAQAAREGRSSRPRRALQLGRRRARRRARLARCLCRRPRSGGGSNNSLAWQRCTRHLLGSCLRRWAGMAAPCPGSCATPDARPVQRRSSPPMPPAWATRCWGCPCSAPRVRAECCGCWHQVPWFACYRLDGLTCLLPPCRRAAAAGQHADAAGILQDAGLWRYASALIAQSLECAAAAGAAWGRALPARLGWPPAGRC